MATIARNQKPGSPLSPTTTSFAYDFRWNKVARVTDPLGLVSTFLYDDKANVAQAVADVGSAPHFNATSRFTYTGSGRLLTATDPVGTVTQYSYDPLQNLTQVTADYGPGRLNLNTTYAYDSPGNLVSQTDPRGNTTTMTYDAARRLLITTAPTPFNSGPLLVRTTNAYDADGRLTSVTRTNGAGSQVFATAYTRTGKVQSVTDPNGNQTSYTYDLVDRLAAVAQPVFTSLNRTTRFTYDALGRLATVVDNTGNTAEQYTYTANGRQETFTDARGNVTKYAYDGFDRPSQTTYAFGTGLASGESFTYDANDNLASRTTRAGAAISFAYDTLNRLTTKTPPSAPVTSYTYDLAGRIKSVSDTGSSIAAAVPPTGTSVTYTTSATYDQVNRPTSFNWSPAPTAATPTASTVTFTHGYNKANQRTSQGASDNSWWYYPTGTSTVTYAANALNQYTAVGAVTPTYDANGNLTFDGTFTLGYDVENRLISASGAGNTVSYGYDAQGRRKSRTVNGVATVFVTDADNREVLEYNGSSGQLQAWYAYGAGSNDVLNRMDLIANTRQTFIPDIQGSVIGTLDSATGAITKRGFLPYGESASTSGTFAYAGMRIDPETSGLYYARARMYSRWGRFMQPDPIGYAGGSNLYAYVGNDPLNEIDPYGLFDLPAIPQPALNFLTGVADAASLGLGPVARKAIDVGGAVDVTSASYTAGQYASLVLGAGRLAYAGTAKALPYLVSQRSTPLETALAVSAARNTLKQSARLGTFPNYRIYTAEQVLAKYGANAELIIAKATQTNRVVNAVGADLAIGAAVGRVSAEFGDEAGK